MLSRWKELEAIHASLSQTTLRSIIPESWHQVILETLSTSSTSNTVMCQASPPMCQHCHQLTALSAVTTMSLLLKERGDRQMEKIYLEPLLQPAVLKCMVDLLLHPCPFLRYQVRRALTTVLTMDRLLDSAVPSITEACVKTVLQGSTDPPLCLEPLQLLCSMLSRRSGHTLNVQTSGFIFPHLPSIYRHCCRTLEDHPSEITTGSVSAQKHADIPTLQEGKENECSDSVKTGDCASALIIEIHTERTSEFPCKRSRTELSVGQEPVLGSSGVFQSVGNACPDSRQYENVHYMFLCLVQKTVKLVNSLDEPERASQLQCLYDNILTHLINDHVPSFSKDFTTLDSAQPCRERKFLDVLDTVLNYTSLRTQEISGRAYEKLATYFIHCFLASSCSWSFPSQRTFIGDRVDKGGGVAGDCCQGGKSDSKAKGEIPDWSGDENQSPVLVLLLLVVLKSCAIVFRTAGELDGELVSKCRRVLHTMHFRLHRLLVGGGPAVGSKPKSPTHLDWLPKVCGEQDDRWMEALLCLLDIFIYARSLRCMEADDLKTLTTLLDPHRLFVQLLHLTHYDSSLLIDWLTSPETCFLAYLTRYLRVVVSDFSAFSHSVRAWNLEVKDIESEVKDIELESKDRESEVKDCESEMKDSESEVKDSESEVMCSKSEETEKSNSNLKCATDFDSTVKTSVGLALLSCYGDDGDGSTDDDNDDDDDDVTDDDDDEECEDESIHISDVACTANSSGYQAYSGISVHLAFSENKSFKSNTRKNMSPSTRKHSLNHKQLSGQEEAQRSGTRERTGAYSAADCVGRVMYLVLAVRRSLEKLHIGGLLMYNPTPLVSLLRQCEQQYQSQCG